MDNQPKHRERIVADARRVRDEIQQMFTDAESWNENSRARLQGAAPIDIDPDGRLRRILSGLNRMLAAEDARPLPPIDGFDPTTGSIH